jgi:hypothetical protein
MERIEDEVESNQGRANQYRMLLEDYGLIPGERQIGIIRNELRNAFEQHRPVQLIHTNPHLGDHFIIRSAFEIVLNMLAEEMSLPKPQISLSHSKNAKALDISRLLSSYGFNISAYQGALNKMYHSYLLWLAYHVGIELSDEILAIPPLPFKCDFEKTPMRNYDPEKVMQHVEALRQIIHPGRGYCVILHGGSKPIKRLDEAQTRRSTVVLETLFPRNGFIVVTAQGIDGIRRDRLNEQDADVLIAAEDDINLTTAVFIAPDRVTTITTDTFLAWLAGGVMALRGDRPDRILESKDLYVLNTVASSTFWEIPGANHYEGHALTHLRDAGRFGTSSDCIIADEDYEKHTPYHPYEMSTANSGIAPADFAGFLRYIVGHNSSNRLY